MAVERLPVYAQGGVIALLEQAVLWHPATARFAHLPAWFILTHINHTKPIFDETSIERAAVLQAGGEIARQGLVLPL